MDTVKQHTDSQLERAKRLIRGMAERTEDRGCSEAEAMEAAVKMGALLQQFDLTLNEVLARDVSDMVTRDVYAADFNGSQIINGIGKLFSLITYTMSGKTTVSTFRMFGHAPDVELGVYMYELCMEALDTGIGQYVNAHGYSEAKVESFSRGFAQRVADRMYVLKLERDAAAEARAMAGFGAANGTSLVILKDQIVESEFGKTGVKLAYKKAPPIKNRGAFHKGHEHGESVNLNNPLAGPAAPAGLLA